MVRAGGRFDHPVAPMAASSCAALGPCGGRWVWLSLGQGFRPRLGLDAALETILGRARPGFGVWPPADSMLDLRPNRSGLGPAIRSGLEGGGLAWQGCSKMLTLAWASLSSREDAYCNGLQSAAVVPMRRETSSSEDLWSDPNNKNVEQQIHTCRLLHAQIFIESRQWHLLLTLFLLG